MAIVVACEHSHRQIRVTDAVMNNTVKCTHCRHLQYVADQPAPGTPAWAFVGERTAGVLVAALEGGLRSVGTNGGTPPVRTPEQPTAAELTPEPVPVETPPAPPAGNVFQEYLYWVLCLTLIPLGFSLFDGKSDVTERMERTQKSNPAIVERWEKSEDASLDDLLRSLPGERIQGAHLPRGSYWHWAYAAASACVFWCLVVLIFPRRATNPKDLLLIGLFTGTVGIFFLLAVQFVAYFTQGIWLTGGGALTLVFYILKFIGFSYRSALDPDSNFVVSFLGFTCGVGLCEELCKAFPLIWYFRGCDRMSWRGACRWGLASGVGFGVAEGITYAADFYNGIDSGGMYVVRFISCVGLHAIWSASVGITLYRFQAMLQGKRDWYELGLPLLRVVAVPMVLHGLYDTLLKMELNEFALVVAVVSFAWLAWQVETLRELEARPVSPTPAPA
jgi:RsiW-degrading membrane proteinase PrsW (M82 family)